MRYAHCAHTRPLSTPPSISTLPPVHFRSILPHEPWPRPVATTDPGSIVGSSPDCGVWLLLQGSFTPRIIDPAATTSDNHVTGTGHVDARDYWTSASSLEHALLARLGPSPATTEPSLHDRDRLIPCRVRDDNNSKDHDSSHFPYYCVLGLPHPVLTVQVHTNCLEEGNCRGLGPFDSTSVDANDEKLPSAGHHHPNSSHTPITKVRLGFASTHVAYRVWQAWRRHPLSPADLFGATATVTTNTTTSKPTAVSWSRRPFQVTPMTSLPLLHVVHDALNSICPAPMSPTTAASTNPSAVEGPTPPRGTVLSTDICWPRTNPPKFRRLIPRKGEDLLTLEKERTHTRFVFVSNLFAVTDASIGAKTSDGSYPFNDSEKLNDAGRLLQEFFHDPSRLVDAIRSVFEPFDTSGYGVEVFLAAHKTKLTSYCHIGLRCHQDAHRVVMELQNRVVLWRQCSNDHDVDGGRSENTVLSGPLFLDYAAITHRSVAVAKARELGEKASGKGLPARSECTSLTTDVVIPGLILVPDFISSQKAEETLMATLTGPLAPWAPSQSTPTDGGVVKRKVQHYGYVFDYRTADVMRDRTSSADACCPPLPALPNDIIGTQCSRSPDGPSDKDLESYAERCVQEGRGWEFLASTLERIRRFDFSTFCSAVGPHNGAIRYSEVNQLTVNQYLPGDGIGSHVDTPSAFGDGLISLSLNAGIVMEFRRIPKSKTLSVDASSGDRKLVYLPPRSLLLMRGPARYEWEHMIVTRMTDTHDSVTIPRQLRVSLTFRTALHTDGTVLPRIESLVFPPMWGSAIPEKTMSDTAQDANVFSPDALTTPPCERDHVHAVYDAIAEQWHHTRGRRGVLWPGATHFVQNLSPGSVVADVGCGDGKYFPAIWEAGSYVIGTDMSLPLLKTAKLNDMLDAEIPENRRVRSHRKHLRDRPAIALADCINIPLRTNSCDAAICIAVLHHISTEKRRVRCLEELARIVRPGGTVMVQAWAMEQHEGSRRRFAANDVFVPFHAQPKYLRNDGNLHEKPRSASLQSSVLSAPNEAKGNGELVSQSLAQVYSKLYNVDCNDQQGLVVFQRYCHLYRKGEMEDLVRQIANLELITGGLESGNHFVIARVL